MVHRYTGQSGFRSNSLDRIESPTISTVSTDTESSEVISSQLGQIGILKRSCSRSDTIRIDRVGNLIVSGSKSHRVCFADELHSSPKPIARVHHIESFKSWNLGNRFDREHGCVCTISWWLGDDAIRRIPSSLIAILFSIVYSSLLARSFLLNQLKCSTLL